MKAKTRIPAFKSEAQERSFWEAHDSTELIDWTRAKAGATAIFEAVDAEYFLAASSTYAGEN